MKNTWRYPRGDWRRFTEMRKNIEISDEKISEFWNSFMDILKVDMHLRNF